jgi:hypothetical protein
MKLSQEMKSALIEVAEKRNIYLEGNIIKIIDAEGDKVFADYLKKAKEQDTDNRKKRLEITKQVQRQYKELFEEKEKNDTLMDELKEALGAAEEAKKTAQNDLDVLQKRTQFELIGKIVNVALWVIMGVGVTTTALYMFAMITKFDTTLIGNAWSNLFGILLTNSFSIIGTIMGVKYASNDSKEKT